MRQELYRGDIYMVVHSPEEKAARMADGWAEIMQPDVTYRFFQHVHPDEYATIRTMAFLDELSGNQVEAIIEPEPEIKPDTEESFSVEIPGIDAPLPITAKTAELMAAAREALPMPKKRRK